MDTEKIAGQLEELVVMARELEKRQAAQRPAAEEEDQGAALAQTEASGNRFSDIPEVEQGIERGFLILRLASLFLFIVIALCGLLFGDTLLVKAVGFLFLAVIGGVGWGVWKSAQQTGG